MQSRQPVLEDMRRRILSWDESGDGKALFLRCYMRMTENMLSAIEQHEFNDPAWVSKLLNHFADYYFVALRAYESTPNVAPQVWQIAHDAAVREDVLPIQKLLLGVNAHINYDLVLTLDDILRAEWASLSDNKRTQRYADHCRVNQVISRTIDAVQDEILEPAMPALSILDVIMGPFDEFLISKLVASWRETVWKNAESIWVLDDQDERTRIIRQVERDTISTARSICSNE
ncbi:MAG: hypothetical protein HKN13_13190 [Rhodothermales bacterium]|nr:hypothetical protein [Rhodothermales bacterium]